MKKFYRLLLLLALTGLASCLKQDPAMNPKQTNNVIEIYSLIPTPTVSPADAVHPLYTQSFEIVPSAEFKVQVSYSGADVAPQDITVTLGLDQQAMNDYNDQQSTSLIFIPTSVYSVDSWTLTIPKGQRLATMTVTFKPNQFNLSSTYGFPVKILSTSFGTISSNFGTVIYAVGVKNKYDGKYSIAWTNYHPSNNVGYTGSTSAIEMHTSGANSCKMFWPAANAYCMPAVLNGGLSYFGGQEPNYTVNATTNAVTVQNVASGAVTFYTMASGFSSRYDPGTKTFYVKFGYSYASPGVFDPGCREWTQTFTYTGPR